MKFWTWALGLGHWDLGIRSWALGLIAEDGALGGGWIEPIVCHQRQFKLIRSLVSCQLNNVGRFGVRADSVTQRPLRQSRNTFVDTLPEIA